MLALYIYCVIFNIVIGSIVVGAIKEDADTLVTFIFISLLGPLTTLVATCVFVGKIIRKYFLK